MLRSLPLLLTLVASLMLPRGTWSAPAKDSVPAQAREMRRAVKGLTEDLYGILGQVSEGGPKTLDILRLELPGAVSKEHLTIDIVRSRGRILFTYGFAPKWNTAVHPVRPKPGRDFKFTGNARSGSIQGKLPVTLKFDGFFPLGGASVNVTVNVNGRINGGKVSGSWSLGGSQAMPGAKGKLAGTMGAVTPRTVPVTLVDKPYEGANHSALYNAAVDLERDADDLYRMARALVVAAAHKVSIGEALADEVGRRPVRPQFEMPKQGTGGKNTRLVAPPDVGDDDLDLGLDDVGGDEDASSSESKLPEAALPVMRDIRDRMVRMQVAAARQRKAGLPEPVTGEIADNPGDPLFGPWFPSSVLPGGKKGPHAVPATQGGGAQKWAFVGNWQVAGPFVRTLPVRHVRLMPDVVESAVGEYVSGVPGLALSGAQIEDKPRSTVYVKWRKTASEPGSGSARVPRWLLYPKDPEAKDAEFIPLLRCSFYARTELTAPRDMSVWFCLYADQYHRLWVNDELASLAPAEPHRSAMADIREPQKALVPHSNPGHDHASRLVFRKVALRKGVNRLLLCVDNDIGGMGFAAHVCTEGAPRKGVQAASGAPKPWLPANIRGWRGQWSGRFADAKPPLAWDLEKRVNILWRTPMPDGTGGPVVAGDRIVTQWEPHGVVCLEKAGGKVLWKRECNILELIDKKLVPEYERLRAEHAKASAEVAKLGAGPEERTAALREGGLSATEAEKKLRELDLMVRNTKLAWQRFFMQKGRLAEVSDKAHMGYAMPTPATDGKHVWVKFGTGVLACFDLDGNRKWMKSLGPLASSTGMFNSPLLLGNRLVVVVNAPGRGEDDPGPVHMLSLDPATGKEQWKTRIYGISTPVPMRLKLGSSALDIIVAGCGRLVRADDGKVIRRIPVPLSGDRAPTPYGEMLYFNAHERMIGVQLIPRSRDSIGVRLLWDHHVLCASHLAAPVRVGDQVYGYARRGSVGALEACNAVTGADARTVGAITWSKPAGDTIPLSSAGGYAFIADDGSSHWPLWPRSSPGSMSILQSGARGRVVARNKIEAMNGPPAFEDDRIYLRARNALMCIGYTGDEGRSYESRVVAGNLVDWIYPERPVRSDAVTLTPLEVKPKTKYPRHGSLPVADPLPLARSRDHRNVSVPGATRSPGWLFAGAFAMKDRDAARASFGDLKQFRANVGTTVTAGATTKSFSELGKRFQQNTATSYRLDLLGPVYGQAGTVSFYYARVHNPVSHTYRVELKPGSARLWVQGVELKHQQRVTLPAGYYVLLVEVPVPDPAPKALQLSLQFWRSDDQDREIANWETDIRRNRVLLETAYAWAHGSDAADRSAALLKKLPDWRPPKVAFRVEEKKTRESGTFAPSPVVLGKAVDKRIEWRDAELKLEGALSFRCRVTDGKWEPSCWPRDVVLPFEGRFRWRHSGTLGVTAKGGQLDMTLDTKLAVHRSRTGTNATFRIKATRADDGKVTGTYTGKFGGKDLSGKVTGLVEDPWPGLVKDWVPVAPCEHPRIMFRKQDLPALRKRMETPEGKAIIAHMKRLLEGRFTNGHPAAYGLLWRLTGDKIWALKCRGALDELLGGRCGIDRRYHFTQPNGQLRAGPSIGVVALAYDLGYDSFDEAYRQKVANRLLNHWYTERIVNSPRHGAGCNHYGAHQGGIGTALLAIRDDPGVDSVKVEDWFEKVLFRGRQGGARSEMEHGFSRYGYYYEGHHCGRISKTGLYPFIHALRNAAGLDCGEGLTNVQWMLTRWVYEFIPVNGECSNLQRGMYASGRFFRRGAGGWSGDGDFALSFGFTPDEHKGPLRWVYNHLVEPDPATRCYSAWTYPHLAGWAFVHWPIGVPDQNPSEVFPNVHHDPDPGYFVFRNGWTGTEKDVVVTALLGSKPRHGRGRAQGGSVEVLGMDLRARFPGGFFHERTAYFKAEKDGSGVVSAEGLYAGRNTVPAEEEEAEQEEDSKSEKEKKSEQGEEKGILEAEILKVNIAEKTAPAPPEKKRELTPHEKAMEKAIVLYREKDRFTALAVDYSGRCGAPVLIAMTGRGLGQADIPRTSVDVGLPKDVKAESGAFTKTTGVIANGRPYYVMTVQKGKAPAVKAQGDKVMVGGLAVHFDGEKLVLGSE